MEEGVLLRLDVYVKIFRQVQVCVLDFVCYVHPVGTIFLHARPCVSLRDHFSCGSTAWVRSFMSYVEYLSP